MTFGHRLCRPDLSMLSGEQDSINQRCETSLGSVGSSKYHLPHYAAEHFSFVTRTRIRVLSGSQNYSGARFAQLSRLKDLRLCRHASCEGPSVFEKESVMQAVSFWLALRELRRLELRGLGAFVDKALPSILNMFPLDVSSLVMTLKDYREK